MNKSAGATRIGFVLLVLIVTATQHVAAADKYRVYFGTGGTVEGQGIFNSVLDVETGELTEAKLAIEAMRPGVIALHPNGTHLYTTGKPDGYGGPRSGSVCAYEIDRGSGSLKFVNIEESKGRGPCYLEVDPAGRHVFVCHYGSGNCSVLPLAEDGSLEPVSSVQQHTGSSEHLKRQDRPHPHSITLDAAGRYAFVPDLGLDQVRVYMFDAASGKLTPNEPPFVATRRGGGPRHFAFHPSGAFAYTNLELTNEVTAFRYDAWEGLLTPIETISTLPEDYSGRNWNAGIRITPDGRHLYVSNRGHNSIARFAVDPSSGKLTLLGTDSTGTDLPHTITIDPTGSYLIATDMRSGRASLFRIDKESGQLGLQSTIEVPGVNMVAMVPID